MTIEQAQLVSELLEDRDNIKAILHRVKADDCLMGVWQITSNQSLKMRFLM